METMNIYLRIGIWVVAIGGGLWVVLCAALYFGQTSLVFLPMGGVNNTPAAAGLDYEDLTLTTEDGVDIHAWFVPFQSGGDSAAARGTILFCHGNAGNISYRVHLLEHFQNLRMNFLIFDYRGFGNSEGEITEAGIYADARAAWRWLRDEKRIAANEIIVHGRSLGGAVASRLTADLCGERREIPAALILESTIISVPEMGAEMFPFLPVRLLSRIKLDNTEHVKAVTVPLLVAHSAEDEIVPYANGKAVFAAANEPKRFVDLAGGHNNTTAADPDLYETALGSFIGEVLRESR